MTTTIAPATTTIPAHQIQVGQHVIDDDGEVALVVDVEHRTHPDSDAILGVTLTLNTPEPVGDDIAWEIHHDPFDGVTVVAQADRTRTAR